MKIGGNSMNMSCEKSRKICHPGSRSQGMVLTGDIPRMLTKLTSSPQNPLPQKWCKCCSTGNWNIISWILLKG